MLHDLVGVALGPVQEIHHLPWPSDWAAVPPGQFVFAPVLDVSMVADPGRAQRTR